ncbi:MAG: hypothetical protein VKS61_15765 [Candidatus Sericytochromatia bacterium]|nr:hypothetical protein [Candidatus Sericytochromatia bacterium]
MAASNEQAGPSWFGAFLLIVFGMGVCAGSGYLVYKSDPKGVTQTIAETRKMLGIQQAAAPEEGAEGEEGM